MFSLYFLSASAQSSHTISLDAVPAVNLPLPAPHVPQVVHAVSLLTPDLNVSAGQAVHVLSAVCTFDAVKYSPAGHSVVFALHDVSAFVPSLYSDNAQAVHVASALADPAVKYSPAGQDIFLTSQGP